MRLGKQYMCEDTQGKVKVLTSCISRWNGEVCFTDGNECYYIGKREDGYNDEIVRFSPYGWSEKLLPRIIGVIMIVAFAFYAGYCIGACTKSIEHYELNEVDSNLDAIV